MADQIVVDFDSAADKARLWAALRSLHGKHRIELTKYRARRTDAQNRLYWSTVVPSLMKFLREQGQPLTAEEVHGILKHKFLRKSVTDPDGVPIAETTRSTTELTIDEFSEYIEMCVAWLADQFDIVVPWSAYVREAPHVKNA